MGWGREERHIVTLEPKEGRHQGYKCPCQLPVSSNKQECSTPSESLSLRGNCKSPTPARGLPYAGLWLCLSGRV